ncbi:MAG TPA: hypothetical protein VJJ22_03010 [Candidatus Paceibacterota bacterium]
MTTQVMFKIDPVIKRKVQLKAKREGYTYSDILQSASRAYLEGKYKMVGLVPKGWEEVPMTKKEQAKLEKARKEFKEGKYYTIDQIRHELGIPRKSSV